MVHIYITWHTSQYQYPFGVNSFYHPLLLQIEVLLLVPTVVTEQKLLLYTKYI